MSPVLLATGILWTFICHTLFCCLYIWENSCWPTLCWSGSTRRIRDTCHTLGDCTLVCMLNLRHWINWWLLNSPLWCLSCWCIEISVSVVNLKIGSYIIHIAVCCVKISLENFNFMFQTKSPQMLSNAPYKPVKLLQRLFRTGWHCQDEVCSWSLAAVCTYVHI